MRSSSSWLSFATGTKLLIVLLLRGTESSRVMSGAIFGQAATAWQATGARIWLPSPDASQEAANLATECHPDPLRGGHTGVNTRLPTRVVAKGRRRAAGKER